jgi:oligoribonuclease NrnB/cAMP/cGMP phosphodiesterase (DHH superfamily)
MTHTICLHHNDEDGRASGAIVRYALAREVDLYETDYDGREIPWDSITKAGRVIVVDFSFPLEDMQKMATGREFIWIDHHKSALTELEDVSRDWQGVRDISKAACVLTWNYFFPERPVPRAVTLIGDRDIWRWAEKDTGAFNEGIHVRETRADNDDLWIPLLEEDPVTMKMILDEGLRLREIRLEEIRKKVERLGFEVGFEGHRTLVINSAGNGDFGQRGRDLGFEIVYCYEDQIQRDILTTSVTLFSRQADVSVIARRYGGGGHTNAAGFSFPRNSSPFPPGADVKWPQHIKQQ